jgi:hypothetical protein
LLKFIDSWTTDVKDREAFHKDQRPTGAGQSEASGSSYWLAALPPCAQTFPWQGRLAGIYTANARQWHNHSLIINGCAISNRARHINSLGRSQGVDSPATAKRANSGN